MRTLKFRVYNYTRNEMTYDIESIQFKEDGSLEQIDTAQDNILWPEKECEVMQFTGLTDKAGVEIYEGDILSKESVFEPTLYSVEWNEKYADYRAKHVLEQQYVDLYGVVKLHPANGGWPKESSTALVEVIGNIYENPELLESNTISNQEGE